MPPLDCRPFVADAPAHGRRATPRRTAVLRQIALLALALGLAEGAVRMAIANAHLSPPVFRGTATSVAYLLAPSVASTVWQAGRPVTVSTDAQGHRLTPGAEQAGAAPALHLIGDSQVFGWGLADHETVAARLQRRWGRAVRVVNHGVPGHGPDDHLALLGTLPESDSVVLVFTEENDAGDSYRRTEPARVACGFMASFTHDGPLQCALLRSRLVQAVFVGLDALRHHFHLTPLGFSEHSQVAGEVMQAHLAERLDAVIARRPGRVLVTVAPWKGRYSAAWRHRYAPPPLTRADLRDMPSPFPDASDTVARFARHPDPASLYLPGDTHLSPAGARLLADHIARHARPLPGTATQETP